MESSSLLERHSLLLIRLQQEIAKGLKSKEDSKKMLEDGAVLVGDAPAQFASFIKSEQRRWAKVVEKAKITVGISLLRGNIINLRLSVGESLTLHPTFSLHISPRAIDNDLI
jgi:hypothetical protein